jgi:hypothetical protein
MLPDRTLTTCAAYPSIDDDDDPTPLSPVSAAVGLGEEVFAAADGGGGGDAANIA